jgi:hypothetical protein
MKKRIKLAREGEENELSATTQSGMSAKNIQPVAGDETNRNSTLASAKTDFLSCTRATNTRLHAP